MFFSGANALPLPISVLQYRDIGSGGEPEERRGEGEEGQARELRGESDESELKARILQERADAVAQAEQQLRQEYEQRLSSARLKIAAALESFEAQRTEYFARVEAEVVQLSLSIAAKILRHEAQLDSMLVATLVRMAVEKMQEGSSVSVRVNPRSGAGWKRHFAERPGPSQVEVVEDPRVSEDDCILETELGSAHFGLDAQLKEVERGFFDLLALRPVAR